MEIGFPLEFIVEGVPVSAQAKRAASLTAWKAKVLGSAMSGLPAGHWATLRPVAVAILDFPDAAPAGDLDNIVKPILDALRPHIYLDDRQVERIWVQRFGPGTSPLFVGPSSLLLEALDRAKPLVYVWIDAEISTGDFR